MSDSALTRFERLGSLPLAAPAGKTGFRGTWGSLRAVFAQRQLLSLLVRRDIKARYKDSLLGVVWTLINPLVQLFVYYVVMGQILGAARGIEDFAIYVFAGLTIYALFSETLAGTTGSIVANAGLVKKVYVPREVFPLASTGSALFTFSVQTLVLTIACLVLGSSPFTPGLLYFIPSVLLIVLYATAFGILMSALNVYFRDVQYLVQIVLTLAMWASPIVYGWTMVHDVFAQFNLPNWLLEVYTNNPLTLAVLGFHKSFWVAGSPADYPSDLVLRMVIAMVVALPIIWICQRAFARLQGNFAQEL